jgi:calcium-dependent protein kinase
VWQAILSQNVDYDAREVRVLSMPARDLLKGLLERDPAVRLTAKQALEHPWVRVRARRHMRDMCADMT